MKENTTEVASSGGGNGKPEAAAGLPGAPPAAHRTLHEAGIDPDRLSILQLGSPSKRRKHPVPPWARRMAVGYLLWLLLFLLERFGVVMSVLVTAVLSLFVGLVILQVACQVLVTATERFAARMGWSHYVAGTVAEILATLPECVVIAFVVPISPLTAFVLAMVTIYNNALVFSIYSYFLPRDRRGNFLMPPPITDAGTQVLIAGGALGLVLGLTMLIFSTNSEHPKGSFNPIDLTVISILLLTIFVAYLYKLLRDLGREEEKVHSALELSEQEIENRQMFVYENVTKSNLAKIVLLLTLGILGAFLGGERVAHFAKLAIDELGLSGIVAAIILAGFAGMSEYVILWTSHRKREYGIALANAFGGITQLLFLIVPFTLGAIAFYQTFVNPDHPDFPIPFSVPNILLVIFLFPTFHTLAALLENDHTMGVLDTVIMVSIVALLILLLVAYGGANSPELATAVAPL
jgi:Ca2+/Na+ antiporter